MPHFENIEGAKRAAIFQRLMDNKTFIQVTLPKSDYDNLTVVIQVMNTDKDFSFQIDPPKGLLKAIAEAESPILFFEFTSDDHVTHRFKTSIQSITQDNITCESPPYIERHQQRNNFRVKVLYHSQATIFIDNTEIRMDIVNVSLGGVYCYCKNKYKPLFEEKPKLKNMELYFTLKDECFFIPIQRLKVNRIENENRHRQFGVAFEFIKIGREARRHLVQQIYELQREFLQNRLKLME